MTLTLTFNPRHWRGAWRLLWRGRILLWGYPLDTSCDVWLLAGGADYGVITIRRKRQG